MRMELLRPIWAWLWAIFCILGEFSFLISHFDNEYAAFYRNDGDMKFTDISNASGFERGTRDMWAGETLLSTSIMMDGRIIFLVNGHVYPQVDSVHTRAPICGAEIVFLNQHDGAFKDISNESGPAIQIPQVSRGMAVGDLFNDGKLEAVVENLVGKPMILRPEGGPKQSLDQLSTGRRQVQSPGVECTGERIGGSPGATR